MTVTVSTTSLADTDVQNAALQAQIAAVQTLVTANTTNVPQNLAYAQELTMLQAQLVSNLMARYNAGMQRGVAPGYINPATVLSTLSINT
jgi:hypothetical protein